MNFLTHLLVARLHLTCCLPILLGVEPLLGWDSESTTRMGAAQVQLAI